MSAGSRRIAATGSRGTDVWSWPGALAAPAIGALRAFHELKGTFPSKASKRSLAPTGGYTTARAAVATNV